MFVTSGAGGVTAYMPGHPSVTERADARSALAYLVASCESTPMRISTNSRDGSVREDEPEPGGPRPGLRASE